MTNIEVLWFIYFNGQMIAVVFLKLFLHIDVLELYFYYSDICADHSTPLGVEGACQYPENSDYNVN